MVAGRWRLDPYELNATTGAGFEMVEAAGIEPSLDVEKTLQTPTLKALLPNAGPTVLEEPRKPVPDAEIV